MAKERKITRLIKEAIEKEENFGYGAITIIFNNQKNCRCYLHGNLIAWRLNGKWGYSHCGYHTTTTANRLRDFGAKLHWSEKGKIIIEK